MKTLIYCSISIAQILSLNTVADTSNNKLEEVVITATRVETPLREIGSSISLMTADDIEMRGQSNLANVLRTQPGISVTNAGGPGKPTALRIRGEEGYRTLLLIDGMDVSDPSSPQVGPRFEQMTALGAQRIEVLRGPQGMLYGADAGGVVNVSTRREHEGFDGGGSVEYGRYNSWNTGAYVGGKAGAVNYSLQASDYSSDGFNSRTDDTSKDDDGYNNTTLHGNLGFQLSDEWKIDVSAHNVDSNNDYDQCSSADFSPSDDCRDDYRQTIYRGALLWDKNTFNQQLSYSYNDIETNNYTDGIRAFGSEGSIKQAQYTGTVNLNQDTHVLTGVDYEKQESQTSSGNLDQDQTGIYSEWQQGVYDSFFYTAGVRYDDNSDFGDHFSYRLTSAYLIPVAEDELKLKASYGTGFRPPSLFEIGENKAPWAFPPASDTKLKEETSKGYDIGAEYHFSNGAYLEAVYFNQEIQDAIEYDLVNYSGYLQLNGDSTSEGVEVIGEMPLFANLTTVANFTYNNANDPAGQQRVRRPKYLSNLGLRYSGLNGKLRFSADYRIVRDVVDINDQKLDDYEILDFNLAYRFTDNMEIYGRVENAMDEDYTAVTGYNSSSVAGYGGVRLQF